jgi:sugar phosphate permease
VNRLHATADVLRGRRKLYYGWWMLGAAVLAVALGSGVSFWSFGLFVSPLENEFGWSRADVSLGFSFSLLASGLCGPLVGQWIDSRGVRSGIIVGAVVTALTYGLLSTTNQLWQWYLYNAVNAAARQFIFIIPFQTLVSRWFDRKRGLALSFLGSGFSLGGLLVLPIMEFVISQVGWRGGFIFAGIALATLYVPIGLLIVKNHPSDIGEHPDGEVPVDRSVQPATTVGLTLREALRQPLFWVVAGGLMLFIYGLLGWQVHQVPFFESKGFSPGTSALIVSLAAGAGMFARLGMGLIADRFRRFEVVIMVLALFLIAGQTTLLISSSWPAIVLFLGFWVIGTSAGPMIEALVLTRAFGVVSFASIFGVIIVIEMAGQIVSPTAAGFIFDQTGSYDAALVMFICTYAACFVLFGIATRMRQPVQALMDERAQSAGGTLAGVSD